jgi:hypothetical protein
VTETKSPMPTAAVVHHVITPVQRRPLMIMFMGVLVVMVVVVMVFLGAGTFSR